ncbi:hypothetical protein [Legionella quateirensis]|uniref:CDP-Glycerol:Poly(Glycerophosphate) glycerophosphotransferase n=1 Tax=Legionella quateirensis TaxID=45072 RepID=A0A378KW64_9GAMM|nr:hypothetical protein [Legionella quateirensis]KTD47619.1 hypothetical protein Lqua_2012 [Legionella quateirensis]STY18626.1 Uncharacterised protein [Legionella quateirensis]
MNIISKIVNRLFNSESDSKTTRPIFVHVATFTEAPLLAITANQLMSKNEFIIFVLLDNNENLKARIKSFIKNVDVQFIYLNSDNDQDTEIKIDEVQFKKIENKYSKYDLDLNTLRALYLIQLQEIARAKKILKLHKPKLLIVAEDGISANTPLIKTVLSESIPVLDIPYGYGSYLDLENALAQKNQNEELYNSKSGAGLAVKEFFPQWIKKGTFEGAILLNPYFILAREELGISVHNPWTVHGGSASRLAAESKAMYAHYLREGIPSEKIVLTGTPYCDYIRASINSNKSIQNHSANTLVVKDKQRSILVCWPPSYHSERAQLCEFDNYQDLTASVLNFLAQLKNVKVTLSLHPAVQPEFKEFVAGFNLNISESYVLDEITQHDIYISCFSSTIRWAIALGKPVVNYDFYKFGINEYKDVPSVLNVTAQNDFEKLVSRLVEDNQFYEETCLNQKKIASDWGILDGSNIERIYGLINQLSAEQGAVVSF